MLVCMQIVQLICSRLTEYAELNAGVAAVCAMAYTHLLFGLHLSVGFGLHLSVGFGLHLSVGFGLHLSVGFGLHLSVGRQACMSASPHICMAAFTQKAGCCVF